MNFFNHKTLAGWIVFFLVFLCVLNGNAKIYGSLPIKKIEIPYEGYDEILDMAQDKDGVLYFSSVGGIKIFDGTHWDLIKIQSPRGLRKLYYDGHNRIYYGGWNQIGYIEKNQLNEYQSINFNSGQYSNKFQSIWDIKSCNNTFYFRSVNYLQSYNKLTNKTQQWYFKSKVGAIACMNNTVLVQDRGRGLVKLNDQNKWVLSDLKLLDNKLILKLESNLDDIFVLSRLPIKQIITKGKVQSLDFPSPPSLEGEYTNVLALNKNKYVLGSINGGLGFYDFQTQKLETFNISNAWISKIIKTSNNDLLILAEFDLFIISWPNPVRIQNETTGLPRNVKRITQWNNTQYVLSSNGIFAQEQSTINSLEPYKKLDWSPNETWSLLPLSKDQALLLESYVIKLVDLNTNTTTAITETIFPRDIFPSKFMDNSYFIKTEFDLQLLSQQGGKWSLKKIYPQLISSIIEIDKFDLLVISAENGLIKISYDSKNNSYSTENVSQEYGLSQEDWKQIKLLVKIENEIYAIGKNESYRVVNNKFAIDDLKGLTKLYAVNSLQSLIQNNQGKLFTWNTKEFFYQDANNSWQKVNTNRFARGNIADAKYSDDEVNILKSGSVISFSNKLSASKAAPSYNLLLREVSIKIDYESVKLAINPPNPITFEQSSDEIKFSYVLTELGGKPHYRYRLIGESEQWTDFSLVGEASFHNLKPQSYRFEFQAQDSHGTIYTGTPYEFTITPYWYLTDFSKFIWFLLFVSFLTLIVFFIIKWREKKYELHELQLTKIINDKTSELKALNKNLQKIALQDGLTGLSNRNYLEDYIHKLAEQDFNSLTVIMFDMDNFKKYNDNYGHLAGDELLKSLAQILLQEIDCKQAIVARYGGEEFISILQDMELTDVLGIAENIRKRIENEENNVSISIGISLSSKVPTHSDALYELIDCADKALYRSKNLGRNQISIHEE